jgi:zinc D-Ala-D-Ala carboxypeptidase
MDRRMQIGKHFQLWEVLRSTTASRLGIENTPNAEQLRNLTYLATHIADPIREEFGRLDVRSGFRSSRLNDALPGASSTSLHMHGCAMDFTPNSRRVSLREVVDWVVASKLEFEEVIYEYGAWIHIACPRRPSVMKGKREALMKFVGSRYEAWDPMDSRVV